MSEIVKDVMAIMPSITEEYKAAMERWKRLKDIGFHEDEPTKYPYYWPAMESLMQKHSLRNLGYTSVDIWAYFDQSYYKKPSGDDILELDRLSGGNLKFNAEKHFLRKEEWSVKVDIPNSFKVYALSDGHASLAIDNPQHDYAETPEKWARILQDSKNIALLDSLAKTLYGYTAPKAQ